MVLATERHSLVMLSQAPQTWRICSPTTVTSRTTTVRSSAAEMAKQCAAKNCAHHLRSSRTKKFKRPSNLLQTFWCVCADLRPLDKAVVKGKTFAEFAEAHKEELAARLK